MSEEQSTPAGVEMSDLTAALGDERSQAEKDLEAGKAQWDSERQERDQDHANKQKDLEDKLDVSLTRANEAEATLADMTTQMADLETKLEAAAKVKPSPLEVSEPELNEEEYGDMAKALNAMRADFKKILATAPTADSSKQVQELNERIGQLEGNLTKIADTSELNTVLDSMDEAHGPEFRNEAQLATKRHFAEQGFSEAKPPTSAAMGARLEAEYLRLKLAKSEESAKKGDEAEVVTGDPGTGGGVRLNVASQFKTAAEAAQDLQESGASAGLDWDE